jgi:hypothetical protein
MAFEKLNVRKKLQTFGAFDKHLKNIGQLECTNLVATLALGSRPKQGLGRVRVKSEAWESHFMILRG